MHADTALVRIGQRVGAVALVVAAALIASGLQAPRARADAINLCGHGYVTTSSFDCAPDLDLLQLPSTGRFAATSAERTGLRALEAQAVQGVIQTYGLPAGDTDRVRTWARNDVRARLFAILLAAAKKDPSARTPEEQAGVDWLGDVVRRRNVEVAQAAKAEYHKFIDYDQNGLEGYCTYVPPHPYEAEYPGDAGREQACYTNPGPFWLGPHVPSLEQFQKWGAAASDATYTGPSFAGISQQTATGLEARGGAVGAGLAAGALIVLANVLTEGALFSAVFPFTAIPLSVGVGAATAAETAAAAASFVSVVSVVAIVVIVIVAIVITVLAAIQVFSADALPGQLDEAITDAQTQAPDVQSMANSDDGKKTLFSLFVESTLNENFDPAAGAGVPTATSNDPYFLVTPKDGTVATRQTSLAVDESGTAPSQTVDVRGSWFVATPTGGHATPTLRLDYTDWDGQDWTAWKLPASDGTLRFLSLKHGSDQSSAEASDLDCNGTSACQVSDTIHYVGADGEKYSAKIHANRPPVVGVTYNPHATEGTAAVFRASAVDPDGDTISYGWQVEEKCTSLICGGIIIIGGSPAPTDDPAHGGTWSSAISGQDLTYTFPDSGLYSVRSIVTDALGARTVKLLEIDVANVAPTTTVGTPFKRCGGGVLNICFDPVIHEGDTVEVAGTVTDPGSADAQTVSIDWGDGTTLTGSSSDIICGQCGPSVTFSSGGYAGQHRYADNGTYTVTITAHDDDGGAADALTTSVTVANANPSLSAVAATAIDEGGTTTLSGTIGDPGTADSHTVSITWGDGSAVQSVPVAAGVTSFSATHLYKDNPAAGATIPASVTVTDKDGGSSVAATPTVSVANVDPVLSSVSSATLNENGTATITGTLTDPGVLDTFSLQATWGDGAVQTVPLLKGATSFSLTHVYLDDNPTGTSSDTYTVSLLVTDKDGGTGTATTTAVVSDVAPTAGVTRLSTPGGSTIGTDVPAASTGVPVRADLTFADVGTTDTRTAVVNWGDGTSSDLGAVGSSASPTHTYATAATRSIVVTVTDDDGLSSTATRSLSVVSATDAMNDLVTRLTDLSKTRGLDKTSVSALQAAAAKVAQAVKLMRSPANPGAAVDQLASALASLTSTAALRSNATARLLAVALVDDARSVAGGTVDKAAALAKTAAQLSSVAAARNALTAGDTAAALGNLTLAVTDYRNAIGLVPFVK